MAEWLNDLVEVTERVISMNDNGTGKPPALLDESILTKLNEIKVNYESVFSWDINEQTEDQQDYQDLFSRIDRIREKCDLILEKKNEFNIDRFCLQLVICYELYNNGDFKGSLQTIEEVIKYLDSCKFSEMNKHYSKAFNHVARATYSYIALSMNLPDSIKTAGNMKPADNLNQVEKSAILAVKAYVFIEYPPIGNDIALKLADQARKLCSTEPEWIVIWLLAKARVRRFFNRNKVPDESEIDAVDMLLCTKIQKSEHLIKAATIYSDVASYYSFHCNYEESNKYYKLAQDISTKAMTLEAKDLKNLSYCFSNYIYLPNKFRSKPLIDEIVEKLKKENNYYVNQVLGKYYLKVEKDYEQAKIFLVRGMTKGTFSCAMQLFKVECMLQPIEQFPYIKTLTEIYDLFSSPKRRLIVLVQILMYYCYVKEDPKELMRYLKLYTDQKICDESKKQILVSAYSDLPNLSLKSNQFLLNLTDVVKSTTNQFKWSSEEKSIVDDTFSKFIKISKLNINGNELYSNKNMFNTTNHREQGKNEQTYKCQPYNMRKYEQMSWRKKQDGFSNNHNKLFDNQERDKSSHVSENSYKTNSVKDIKNTSWRNRRVENN